MLSNVLSGSNTVTLGDFSNLMQNCSAERARLIWNKVIRNTKTAVLCCENLAEVCKKRANTPAYFARGPMLRVPVGATGGCFPNINLSDLTLSSFWTSDPQQEEAATQDSQPGCDGFMWALSGCSGWCYISPLPGTCHLQPSHPQGLHNSK